MATGIVERVRTSALQTDTTGRACRAGARYSGLGYRVDDEGMVCEMVVYEDGVATGVSEDWLPLVRGVRIDRASLEIAEDYGPLLFRGAPVDGVVYDFTRDGACVREEALEFGQSTGMACNEWYSSGARRSVVNTGGGWGWFENGRLRTVATGSQLELNLLLSDEGRLRAIVLHNASLLDIETLGALSFDDEVLLTGRALDDQAVDRLFFGTGFRAVPRVRLIETAVGPLTIAYLGLMSALREVWLTRNRALNSVHAEALRRLRPDCTVHEEGEAEPAGST